MSLPSPARRRAVTLLATLPWALVLFQFLLILPRYDRLFRNLGLKVPDLTALMLNISAWVRTHVLPSFLITFALMGVSVFIAHLVQTTPMSRGRRLLFLLIVFGMPCLAFVVAWVGVIGTERRLVEGFHK
jgi:type II secretory pathway component PulF